jgi:hypothetical protein
MTNADNAAPIDTRDAKYFKIRKEVVGLCLLTITCWAAYQVHDWWSHVDWPPFPGTNELSIQALKCKNMHPIDINELQNWDKAIDPKRAIDRRSILSQPQCLAGTYLSYEGSGTRQYLDVIDTEKKRRLARIEITFDRDERALK